AVQAPQGSLGVRSAPSETAPQDSQKLESAKSSMKDERQLERTCSDTGGTSISSKAADDDAKHGVTWSKENANHLPMIDILFQEFGNLRPGIAPGLKFGGTGNSPDLPWVSTTGGPNGKTISGAMYRYNRNQVRIVCACHGRHMSPTEFVQHANDADASNLDNNVVADSFPAGNQATSAQDTIVLDDIDLASKWVEESNLVEFDHDDLGWMDLDDEPLVAPNMTGTSPAITSIVDVPKEFEQEEHDDIDEDDDLILNNGA
ncbi:hypothetical protein KI387_024069, partial [Taxus chinensis]